jgi:hypothetical protein
MTGTLHKQHPAVVLRTHYTHLKALLAVVMIAVVGLSAAVVVLAVRDDATSSADPLSLMTPADRHYVEAISSLSDGQLAAAFGTDGTLNNSGAALPRPDRFEHGNPAARWGSQQGAAGR